MVSVTRDSPPPETTLLSVYMRREGRERVRDRERPGPSENQATVGSTVNCLL